MNIVASRKYAARPVLVSESLVLTGCIHESCAGIPENLHALQKVASLTLQQSLTNSQAPGDPQCVQFRWPILRPLSAMSSPHRLRLLTEVTGTSDKKMEYTLLDSLGEGCSIA